MMPAPWLVRLTSRQAGQMIGFVFADVFITDHT
jgi:hypothetical protein